MDGLYYEHILAALIELTMGCCRKLLGPPVVWLLLIDLINFIRFEIRNVRFWTPRNYYWLLFSLVLFVIVNNFFSWIQAIKVKNLCWVLRINQVKHVLAKVWPWSINVVGSYRYYFLKSECPSHVIWWFGRIVFSNDSSYFHAGK